MPRKLAVFWPDSSPVKAARVRSAGGAILIALVITGPVWAASSAGAISPLELRDQLVKRFLAGDSVAPEVREYRARTSDHSFDSLEVRSPGKIEALRLASLTATDAWLAGDLDEALRRFEEAHGAFLAEQAWSEAGFCLYYIAEILGQQELYPQALDAAERASPYCRGSPFLKALLCESRGYSLWYLDRLRLSAAAFSQAGELWTELDYPLGIVGAWNNVAALYEEMGLWERAAACYRKALDIELRGGADAQARFYLHSNYAVFLAKRGQSDDALKQLREAERFGYVSPDELFLVRSRILGVERRQVLERFAPQSPSLRIEKALLLADFYSTRDRPRARRELDRALRLSSQTGLRHYRRAASLAVGQLLESEGWNEEAARHYFNSFKEEENFYSPELLFPYSQAVSPLFDGWIRSLINAGREEEALVGIRRLVELRRIKAQAIPAIGRASDAHALQRFNQAVHLEPASLRELGWDSIPACAAPPDCDATLVELWPDRNEVHAWVTRDSKTSYRRLRMNRPVVELMEPVISGLYTAGGRLPPAPQAGLLENLHGRLVAPLENELGAKLVIVAHKDLQALPFEMLRDQRGRYLVEKHVITYLPRVFAPAGRLGAGRPGPGRRPVAVLPRSTPTLPSVRDEELFFRTALPDVEIWNRLDPSRLGSPAWLHVSAHLKLDTDFWIASGFHQEAGGATVLSLIDATRSCSIVSLGVCDAGNAYSSHSPYWLGFSELFLSRGAAALLVSRWALDDFSARIYRDFYAAARQGLPMDEALTVARRRFLGLRLERSGVSAPGSHPYFWAGLAYVGYPGQRLYDPDPPRSGLTAAAMALPTLAVLLLWIFRLLRRRPR